LLDDNYLSAVTMFLLQLLLFYLCGVRAFHRCYLSSVTHCRKYSLKTLKMAKANRFFRIVKPKSLPDSETIGNQAASGVQKDSHATLEPSSNVSDSSKLIPTRSKIATHVGSNAGAKAAKISPIPPPNQSAQSTDEIELNLTAAKEETCLKLALNSALEAPDSFEADDYVSRLRDTGVVRVNSVIQSDVVNQLVRFIQKELADSIHVVTANEVQPLERFSNMLSSNNRWDLKLPLDNPIILNALRKIFNRQASVSKILTSLVTERGELFELAAFCTSSGAARQVVHADTLWSKHPALYTCAIALQDVTEDMGPTLFLPGKFSLL
jgi:Phytanoyl-CoA dioxygenase (PhyH)